MCPWAVCPWCLCAARMCPVRCLCVPHKRLSPGYVPSSICMSLSCVSPRVRVCHKHLSPGCVPSGVFVSTQACATRMCPPASMCPQALGLRASMCAPRCPCVPPRASHTCPHKDSREVGSIGGTGQDPRRPQGGWHWGTLHDREEPFPPQNTHRHPCPELAHPKTPSCSPHRDLWGC